MKTRYLLILLAFALSACHTPTHEAKRMVARAERLMDSLPDSAVRLIDSVLRMEVYFSERERMDMALLQGEALFCDAALDDDFSEVLERIATSPELERAANYYAKKKQYDKAAHAALYSGYVQQHYNEKDAAMQSFKDAERFGGMAGDSLCMARAEYNMGKMLYSEYMKEEALAVLKTANLCFVTRYADKALVQNAMAVCYILLGDYDQAEQHLQSSLEYADKGHSIASKIKALNNQAVLFKQKREYDKALASLRQAEALVDTKGKLIVFLNMAKVFMVQKDTDSTSRYLQQVEEALSIVDVKEETQASAYDAFAQFAESQGDYKTAYQYRSHCDKILLDVMERREQKNIYRIQQQYDYEALQNTMNKKLARTQRVIAIVIVLLLGTLALFLFRSSQRNKKEAEANANLFHFMQQNKELVESNMAHERKVLDTTQQLSDVLYARLMAMQKLDYCLKTPKDKIALKDLEREVFGTGDHWEAVREVLAALYPGLEETLRLKYPEMDEMELRVCMLSRLKLSRLGEATLLGISVSVLDKLRMKIRKMTEE